MGNLTGAVGLAITLRESLSAHDLMDCLILATDISTRMLEKASHAVYSQDKVQDISASQLKTNFTKILDGSSSFFQLNKSISAMVRFAWLNLVAPWPMKGPFNVIFCRNVMIYFDRSTQQNLINRFWDILAPGGYLFVGHSEGLSAISHQFHYVQPAIYRK